MWRDQAVLQAEQGMITWDRLGLGDVDSRASDLVGTQRAG